MPIKSYIVIPKEGQYKTLQNTLSSFPECEITPSENKDIIVLLTDTANEAIEKKLFLRLLELPALQHINLVSAFQ